VSGGGERIEVMVRRLAGNDLPAPRPATPGSSGVDLRACVPGAVTLEPGQRALIPTGLALAIPPGYEAQVRPRSGLAARSGLTMLNTPGTIDADYRGEVQVLAVNLGSEAVVIQRGDRIAQMVFQKVPAVDLVEVDELPASSRGAAGFGSTGTT
jgi:dUTP pyrophosphatase